MAAELPAPREKTSEKFAVEVPEFAMVAYDVVLRALAV
jgi:hypothetical protein